MKSILFKSITVGIFGALSLPIFPLFVRAEETKIKVSCNKSSSTEISTPTHYYYLRSGEAFRNDLYRAKQLCENIGQKLQFHGDRHFKTPEEAGYSTYSNFGAYSTFDTLQTDFWQRVRQRFW